MTIMPSPLSRMSKCHGDTEAQSIIEIYIICCHFSVSQGLCGKIFFTFWIVLVVRGEGKKESFKREYLGYR